MRRSPPSQPRSTRVQHIQPRQRQLVGPLREFSLSPSSPIPLPSRNTPSRAHRGSARNLRTPNKVDVANQRITLAKEAGESLRDAALSDLRSSFSSVLSTTTPKASPTDALWPTGDPLLNLKSASRAAHLRTQSKHNIRGDALSRRLFTDTNYDGES